MFEPVLGLPAAAAGTGGAGRAGGTLPAAPLRDCRLRPALWPLAFGT